MQILLLIDLSIALPLNLSCFKQKLHFCNIAILLCITQKVAKQVGTLKYFREKLNRKNVTPNKVLESYDGCEELFLSVGKAYITIALMSFFKIENIDDYPTGHCFENNMIHKPCEKRKQYFDHKIGEFVDNYIFQSNQRPPCGAQEDFVKNYTLCFGYLSLFLMQLIDTTKEADGDRNLIDQKTLLIIFRPLNYFSKCAIEMFVSIAQIECLLTPRLLAEFRWRLFCNLAGGKTRNIEDDLAQKIYNKISKNAVKHLRSNKSIETIDKICRAASGIKQI